MKKLAFVLMLMIPGLAAAQTTAFTLGAPDNNYFPALTQDGVATSGNWWVDYVYDCAVGTYVCTYGTPIQGTIQISLPNDPSNPGVRLLLNCTGVQTSNTIPPIAATQQPPGQVTSTETCSDEVTQGTWVGTVTYLYNSVRELRGRRYAWYPVPVGGYGSVTVQ